MALGNGLSGTKRRTSIVYKIAMFFTIAQPFLAQLIGGVHVVVLEPTMTQRIKDPHSYPWFYGEPMEIAEDREFDLSGVNSDNVVGLIQNGTVLPLVKHVCIATYEETKAGLVVLVAMLAATFYLFTYVYLAVILATTLRTLIAGAASINTSGSANKMKQLSIEEIRRGLQLVASMFFLSWQAGAVALRLQSCCCKTRARER